SVGVPEATPGRNATVIADQRVEADGSISVPYAGRIPAAGRTAEEVQKTIEARLAEKALQPQALGIVQKTAANTVTALLNESGGAQPHLVRERPPAWVRPHQPLARARSRPHHRLVVQRLRDRSKQHQRGARECPSPPAATGCCRSLPPPAVPKLRFTRALS